MGEVAATLKVPAGYVDVFRRAVLDEIETDAGAMGRKKDAEDIRSSTRLLDADLELLKQVSIKSVESGLEVRGVEVHSDAETLAHAAETMARKVVGPRLVEELQTSPIDSHCVPELRSLVKSLSWAIDSAGLLHERARRDRVETS